MKASAGAKRRSTNMVKAAQFMQRHNDYLCNAERDFKALRPRLQELLKFEFDTIPTFEERVVERFSDEECDDIVELHQVTKPAWSQFNSNVVLHHSCACAVCGEEPIAMRRVYCKACHLDFCMACSAKERFHACGAQKRTHAHTHTNTHTHMHAHTHY
jgi:hypothetical protein